MYQADLRFNSKLVRLKDAYSYIYALTVKEFQFQIGAIKSLPEFFADKWC